MGCSSSRSTKKVQRLQPAVPARDSKGRKLSAEDPLAGALDEAVRHKHSDRDGCSFSETATGFSRSASVHSIVSGVTSLHSSLHSSKYHVSSRRVEEMQSEVPAISESVADLADLQEVAREEAFVIDNRQHPLAPSNISMYSSDSRLSTTSPCFGDLDCCCSEVPSWGDDASVASAPPDVCVKFKRSFASSSRCGSKEETGHNTLGSPRMDRHSFPHLDRAADYLAEGQLGTLDVGRQHRPRVDARGARVHRPSDSGLSVGFQDPRSRRASKGCSTRGFDRLGGRL